MARKAGSDGGDQYIVYGIMKKSSITGEFGTDT